MTEPRLISIPAAGRILGISDKGVRRAAERGQIIIRKIGQRAVVDVASLHAFADGLPVVTYAPERPARKG